MKFIAGNTVEEWEGRRKWEKESSQKYNVKFQVQRSSYGKQFLLDVLFQVNFLVVLIIFIPHQLKVKREIYSKFSCSSCKMVLFQDSTMMLQMRPSESFCHHYVSTQFTGILLYNRSENFFHSNIPSSPKVRYFRISDICLVFQSWQNELNNSYFRM